MKKIAAFKFTLATAALILVLLLLPASSFSKMPSFRGIDKIVHFCLFFLFALSYLVEFKRYYRKMPGFFHSVIIIVVFILASETLQLFTRTRHFEFMDMAFDALGTAAAFILTSERPGRND